MGSGTALGRLSCNVTGSGTALERLSFNVMGSGTALGRLSFNIFPTPLLSIESPGNISCIERFGCLDNSSSNFFFPILITSGIFIGTPPGIRVTISVISFVSDFILSSTFDNDKFPENKNNTALEPTSNILNPLLIRGKLTTAAYIRNASIVTNTTQIAMTKIIFKTRIKIFLAVLSFFFSSSVSHLAFDSLHLESDNILLEIIYSHSENNCFTT